MGGSEGIPADTNRGLLVPYIAPYAAYVGVAALLSGRVAPEIDYAVRIVLTGGILAFYRRRYARLGGPGSLWASSAAGVGGGLLGAGVWIACLLPVVDVQAGPAWGAGAFALRLAAATLLVPLFEELLLRGYVLRLVVQWSEARGRGEPDPFATVLDRLSIGEVAPGAWTAGAVLLSSLAFALGHSTVQMPAAFAYGLLMAVLWIVRGDLLTCVVAHATTNLVLYVYIYFTGSWGLW